MSGVEVIVEDLDNHPKCPHGPTILFSRVVNGSKRKFYACSACRDRKDCSFFLWHGELAKCDKTKRDVWERERKKLVYGVNHRNLFLTFNEVRKEAENVRMYCYDCNNFQLDKYKEKHRGHNIKEGVSDSLLGYPSQLLEALDDSKKEAQYLFNDRSVEVIVGILKQLKLRNIICIGAPRIHEYIKDRCGDMESLLLDIDKRLLNFWGPLEFCWYNAFNNYFFLDNSKSVFSNFLEHKSIAIVTDPPFGGRIEPLAATFKEINKQFQNINQSKSDIPIFWTFPYFMEPQILNSFPNFHMLDYKVDYDNHSLFSNGPKGRKQGSPVRIFTNVDPCSVQLPENEGYKFCKQCKRWVSAENRHCTKCKSCTSKDGRTYEHCDICARCVKPTWRHCESCGKCAQPDHKCGVIAFEQECFHCKKRGHKKRECPNVDRKELQRKRKAGDKFKNKRRKIK